MEKRHSASIKARGIMLSGAAFYYLTFIYIGFLFAYLVGIILLLHFFPFLQQDEWLLVLPLFFPFFFPVIYLLFGSYTVILEPEEVILKWFGIPFRRIPVSRFKTFCAVGNGEEDVLCLCGYSADEMVQMQEQRLLRSVLNKHNVQFQKRKPDWQNEFARGYLNYLRKSPFSIFRERNMVMLEMHPAVQYSLRQMYPQLPYMNCTGVTSCHIPRFSGFKENRAVCGLLEFYPYEAHIEADGIHISTKRKDLLFIPAQQIKTAVRVDIFRGYAKHIPHHIPLLFITTMSEEELALQAVEKDHKMFLPNEPHKQALLAMMAAMRLAPNWNKSKKNCCVVYHTQKNLDALKTHYPHIQINDISANWLDSSFEGFKAGE